MQYIKDTALSICILVAFISLITIIAPQDKFFNMFKIMLNLLTLLLILKPFLTPFTSFNNEINKGEFTNAIVNYREQGEEMMTKTIDETINLTLQKQIKHTLKADGIDILKVDNVFSYNKNNLYVEKVIVYVESDIAKEKIKDSVLKIINTNIEIIYI